MMFSLPCHYADAAAFAIDAAAAAAAFLCQITPLFAFDYADGWLFAIFAIAAFRR